jgi:hypothetical protein
MSDKSELTKFILDQPPERAPGLALRRWSAPKVIATTFGSTGANGATIADTSITQRHGPIVVGS